MDEDYIIRKVETRKWEEAQKFEYAHASQSIMTNDDWNYWWAQQFEYYALLNNRIFKNIIEVGCGPYTNMRYILPFISAERIYFEDPLIQFYLSESIKSHNSIKNVIKHLFQKRKLSSSNLYKIFSAPHNNVEISSSKLESLPYKDNYFDLLVCINVLDHVNDSDACFREINRVMQKKGILILGQDLSNKADYTNCPESYKDIGHPIKLDEHILDGYIDNKYNLLMKKILPRKEGRNPIAHYGTYLLVAEKL